MAYAPVAPLDDDDDVPKANADLDIKGDRETRQEAAVALRIAGANWSEIMRALDYASVTQARQAVERALASSVGDDDKKQARFIQNRRIDRLLRSVWAKATDEDREDQLAYVRAALALIDRGIRLGGLDAPQELTIYNPTNREVEEWIQVMVEQNRGELPQEYDIIEGVAIEDDPIGDDEK